MINFGTRKAFTLAEVLITLSIIGVVAALTIPVLINNVNNAGYATALQKNYAVFQQAFLMLKTENGGSIIPVFEKDTNTNAGNGEALNAFLTKMNYAKNCANSTGCWYDTPTYLLDRSHTEWTKTDSNLSGTCEKAILSNGAMIKLCVASSTCSVSGPGTGPIADGNVCGELGIDVNGEKGPNANGRDYFGFHIARTGIYPKGANGDMWSCGAGNDYFTSRGCTTKVLQDGAMNY